MKLRSVFAIPFLVTFLVFMILAALAAGTTPPRPASSEGWQILLDGASLNGWHPLSPAQANEWRTAAKVKLHPQDEHRFLIEPGRGTIVNGERGNTVNLVSDTKHGDVEAHIEFLVSKNSNSGVYFMGLYEIQILDSFGKKDLAFGDCGGIYARWINEQNVGGAPPRVNASKAPGEWQTFDVRFRAPRFDGAGKKIENARFLKVVHNGVVVHENVEVNGPTRASMEVPEASRGPLMLQGDHGPVAFRNIRIRTIQERRIQR